MIEYWGSNIETLRITAVLCFGKRSNMSPGPLIMIEKIENSRLSENNYGSVAPLYRVCFLNWKWKSSSKAASRVKWLELCCKGSRSMKRNSN
ncbi:hypothetical protein TNCV_3164071 [Trichonephila clavipes]|nr:hypothetical protein TNCV_3164071 [Trichonephila clavipes]